MTTGLPSADSVYLDVEPADDTSRHRHELRPAVRDDEDARLFWRTGRGPAQDDALQRHGDHVGALGGDDFRVTRQAGSQPWIGLLETDHHLELPRRRTRPGDR